MGRMDVDTHWPYHRKVRKLQLLYPNEWPVYWAAYMVLLAEAWATSSRHVNLEDAWCPALPCSPTEARDALVAAGITDRHWRIPTKSWDDWHGPVEARFEAYRERGRAGGLASAEVRRTTVKHKSTNGAAQVNPHPPYPPTNQPTVPTPRARGSNDPVRLRDLLPPPPGHKEAKA